MTQGLISCVNRGEEEQQLVLAVACKQLLSSPSCCFLSCTYSSKSSLGLTCVFVSLKGCWGCLRLDHNLHLTYACQKVSELNLALQLQDLQHWCFTPMNVSALYQMWLMHRLCSKECRPSALSEAVLFHQQFPDRKHCLFDERIAISWLSLALLYRSSHALRDMALDFFPSAGQVISLDDAALSLARDMSQPQENYFPPN